eukprot:scaffold14191_cov67-Phaeocystis_antarctica.AAC.1
MHTPPQYLVMTRLQPHIVIVTTRGSPSWLGGAYSRRPPLDRQAGAHRPLGRRWPFPPVGGHRFADRGATNGGAGRRGGQARGATLCRGGDGRHRAQSDLRLGLRPLRLGRGVGQHARRLRPHLLRLGHRLRQRLRLHRCRLDLRLELG